MAREMHRWNPGKLFVVLRISNIFEPADYATIPSFWDDPSSRQWNLWSWVDSRDVAQACRLSLEADGPGWIVSPMAGANPLMRQTSRELMATAFPTVPVDPALG